MQVASVFSTHVNVSVLCVCVCAHARVRACVRACVRGWVYSTVCVLECAAGSRLCGDAGRHATIGGGAVRSRV